MSKSSVKQKKTLKFLKTKPSLGGLAQSVAATFEAREGKICGACLEIVEIVNDWRSQAVGGMETALLLWESFCILSLLHGVGTGTEITQVTEKNLTSYRAGFVV